MNKPTIAKQKSAAKRAKTTTMNLRMDVDTRRQLQAFAGELGIPATTLVVMRIKQMLAAGEITLRVEPTPGRRV